MQYIVQGKQSPHSQPQFLNTSQDTNQVCPTWVHLKQMARTKFRQKVFSPRPGIEPGPSTWQAEILTTRLSRICCTLVQFLAMCWSVFTLILCTLTSALQPIVTKISFWLANLNLSPIKILAPGEARTHSPGIPRCTPYKYRALSDCTAGSNQDGRQNL